MGLLDELIILVKETIDEANERNRPRPAAAPTSAPQRSEEEIEALRRTLARRAAEARMAEEREAERNEAEQRAHAEQERQRAHERERQQQKQADAARVAQRPLANDQRRITRLLRQPNTVREMIVLREILDKPLALRRR